MKAPRSRALVLAAGLGTRLRPLTELTPKPLLPVAGAPIVANSLSRLAAAGCEAAVLNLHHHGERIREAFGDEIAGMPLGYSEEPDLLGTLGALGPPKDFLADSDVVLVVNGDSLCRWPVKALVRKHLARGADATLLLTRRADPRRFGGGVGVDGDGRILSFRSGVPERGVVKGRFVFAGCHALSPRLLDRIPAGPADSIRDLYEPILREGGRVQGVVSSLRWHDLGTPWRYLDGVLDWARGSWPERAWRRSWISDDAVVSASGRLRTCVVEEGCRVEEGARLERTVLLPGARVGRGSVVREAILGAGAVLPPGTWVERRIIVPQSPEFRPREGDSLVGGMVYTPIPPKGTAGAAGAAEEAASPGEKPP